MSRFSPGRKLRPRIDNALAKPGSHHAKRDEVQLGVERKGSPTNAPAADPALQEILQRALGSVTTTSAAIALHTEDGVRCRATIGTGVPEVGTRLYPGRGLTGWCLQSGKVELCNDTDADLRVNSEACKELGIRSVLVLPLKKNGAVLGVLEVASTNPQSFTQPEVARMRKLADQVMGCVSGTAAKQNSAAELCQPEVGGTVPSNLDLQKLLESAYVLQQHGERLRPDIPATRSRDNRVPNSLRSNITANTPAPRIPENDELKPTALPADFGQEYPTGARWSGTLIAVLLAVAGMLAYGYYSNRSARASMQAGTVRTSETQRTAQASPDQSKYDQRRFEPNTDQTLNASRELVPTIAAKPKLPLQDKNAASHLMSIRAHRADAADPNSEYEMGVQCAEGTALPQDYIQAMAWFAKAAAKGDARAQWELGQGYLEGIGVPQDDNKAAEWFKKAANQGNVEAQSALSEMYLNGWGVPRDYVRAYTWSSIAAESSGDQDELLQEMASSMTQHQLQEAQQRISNWRMRVEPPAEDAQPNRSPSQ
jgi:hypothetical protein